MKDKKTVSLIIAIFSVVIIVIAGIIVVQESKEPATIDTAQSSAVKQEEDGQSGADKTTEEVAEFSLGEIQGNAYYNSFAGIMFNLPSDDWSFLDAEEAARLVNAKVSKSKPVYSNHYGKLYYDACILDKKTKTSIQLALFESNEKKNLNAKILI